MTTPAPFRRLRGIDLSTCLPATRRLEIGLQRLGWRIVSAELDLARETARIELRRDDLVVTFDARNGRASVTRERLRVVTVAVGRRGDRFLAEQIRMEFVGRTKLLGARSGLRWLAHYIADNAAVPAVRGEVKDLFRGVMDDQKYLIGEQT